MLSELSTSAVPLLQSCCPGGADRAGYAVWVLAPMHRSVSIPWSASKCSTILGCWCRRFTTLPTSAAGLQRKYWDLTEQIFRDIVVMTERPVRAGSQERHGASFTLRHVRAGMMFGTRSVWRGKTRIAVSDVHRTIIDMLDDPELGAGIQHVDDCLASYFGRKDRDDGELVAYADRIGNGAIFKRLGFLTERSSGSTALLDACRERLTQGNAKLDPAFPCRRLVTRWRLFVPESWIPAAPA